MEKNKYFKPDKYGQSNDKWILTDPIVGNQIIKMNWKAIVRHTMVKHDNSPFNGELKEYYKKRDIKKFLLENVAYKQKLAKKQKYKCHLCGESIVDGKESLETHHKVPRCNGGTNGYKNIQLVHTSCHILHHKKFPARKHLPVPTLQETMQNRKWVKEEKQKDTWKLRNKKSRLTD